MKTNKQAASEASEYKKHLEHLVSKQAIELDKLNRELKKESRKRKLAELQLLREKRFSEDIIMAFPAPIYALDEKGKFFKWNKYTEVAAGYSSEEMKNIRAIDLFEGKDKRLVTDNIHAVFKNKRATFQATLVKKDGGKNPYLLTGVKTSINNKDYLVGVGMDCEELENVKKALQESETKLRAILSAVSDCMIIIDKELKIVWANDHVKNFFGNDLIDKKCFEVLHNLTSPCRPCIGLQCLDNEINQEREGQWILPNGSRKDFWSMTSIVNTQKGEAPNLILELFRDITEKKAYQAETVRVGQLAYLGELAAGVAHEINNPINGILNYVQILIDKSDKSSNFHDTLSEILIEVERIASIVDNLLNFARMRKEEYDFAHLNMITNACLNLTGQQLLNDGISVRVKVPSNLPKIYCNSRQLQQVFLNIISNARYALNKKFKKLHKNKILDIQAEGIRINGHKVIRTTICDYGTGIPAEIINKICSPFFTTKPSDEGTGLGLNISHGIVKNHGGRLWFESKLGNYTKVILDLPTSKRNIQVL
jgi:PAS domain S-box-containing protein